MLAVILTKHDTFKTDLKNAAVASSAVVLYFMVHNRFYFTSYRELRRDPAAFTTFNVNVFISLTHIIANVFGAGGNQKCTKCCTGLHSPSLNPSTALFSLHSRSSVISVREIYFQFLFCHF